MDKQKNVSVANWSFFPEHDVSAARKVLDKIKKERYGKDRKYRYEVVSRTPLTLKEVEIIEEEEDSQQ